MKQSFFYLLLLIATFIGTSSFAADWNIPEPQPSTFVQGDTFAIRNVGLQMVIYRGEAWETQVCVNDKGQAAFAAGEYLLVAPTIDEANTDTWGSYYILFDSFGTWGSHCICRQPGDGNLGYDIKGCFIDGYRTADPAALLWDIKPVGGNKYTIGVPPTVTEENGASMNVAYVEGDFLGVQLDHPSRWAETNAEGLTYGVYYDVVYADKPENCQWEFINKKDIDVYNAKVELAKMCDDAAEVDINTADYAALVNNSNATLEEINAAIAELTAELKLADSWKYPTEITEGIIENPNPYHGSSAGWTVLDNEGKEVTSWRGASSKEGDWWIGEFWMAAGYSIHQTIHVPAGVYTLRCYALTRDYTNNAMLKVGDNQTHIIGVPSSVANNRSAAANLFAKGICANDISWVQLEEGDIEICLTADNTTGDHWLCWRNFQLFDRGVSLYSYQKVAESLADGWENEFIDENGEPRSPLTQSYFDAVTSGTELISTSTDSESALAIYNMVKNALNDLRTNVFYYKELKAHTYDQNSNKYDDSSDEIFGGNEDFSDVWNEAQEIFIDEDYTKTNEYLENLYNRYMEARQNAIFGTIEATQSGGSVTAYIENPHFKNEDGTSSSFDGWTVGSSSTFQNNAGSLAVTEQWNGSNDTGTIDVYQEIAIRKVGAYRLKTKGWYQSNSNLETHDNEPDYQKVNTFLYAASSEYKFHDIYEHPYTPTEKQQYFPKGNCFGTGENIPWASYRAPDTGESDEDYIAALEDYGFETVYPRSCTGANELFNNPDVTWYDMTCDFLGLGLDSPVKIGVCGRNIPGYAWIMWDDFELIYLGDDLETIKGVLHSTIQEAANVLKNVSLSYEETQSLRNIINEAGDATTYNEVLEAYRNLSEAIITARETGDSYENNSFANYLKKTDIAGHTGQHVTFPVNLINENTISGFQMEMVLPEGVEVVVDENEEYFVEMTDRTKGFSVSVTKSSNNTYRLVVMSMAGKTISGNVGEVLNIKLNIAEDMTAGDYELWLKEIRLTVKDVETNTFSSVTPPDVVQTLKVCDVSLGDVNDDGIIDVTDAVLVVSYILEQNPVGFVELAADVNDDGIINVADAICIVNIILSQNNANAKAMMPKAGVMKATDSLSLQQTDTNHFSVSLSNTQPYVGFQMDISLPESVMLDDVMLNGQRSSGHSLSWQRLSSGSYRVVSLSLGGNILRGTNGELLSFETTEMGYGPIAVDQIVFVTSTADLVRFEPLMMETTGITQMENEDLRMENTYMYDLQGRKRGISRLNTPGIYVVNGRKIVVR